MRALWLANGLNIVLDPLLIFGWGPIPALGVPGAAIATALGRSCGVAYQLWMLRQARSRLRLSVRDLNLDVALLGRILRVSFPGMLQYIIGTASWLALFRIIAVFGSVVVAGYTIGIRILIFALLPSWGMGNAAATLVGQNLGAGRPDRAERSVWLASFTNMAFLGLVTLVFLLRAEPLVSLFSDEAEVIAYGVRCLHIVSYTYVFFAFGMVTVQAFNGAGDTTTPTLINFVSHWLLQIPLAFGLARVAEWGPDGVFWAIAIAQAFLATFSVLLFRRGGWKEKSV
jgi:putative MATE family efflux protein